MTKQLMRDMTDEELLNKIDWEGIEYFFLEYVDPNSIADLELRKSVNQLKQAWGEILFTLGEIGYDEG